MGARPCTVRGARQLAIAATAETWCSPLWVCTAFLLPAPNKPMSGMLFSQSRNEHCLNSWLSPSACRWGGPGQPKEGDCDNWQQVQELS